MPQVSARQVDNNGFMIVRGCPLSREGIYEYSAKQIGLDGDPNRIVKVYRPDDAVRDQDSINSFKSVPLIDDHEMLAGIGGAHPEYTAPEEKGIEGILTDNVYYDESDGWMKGDVKVFTRNMLAKVEEGKDDLSLGFGCLFYLEPGVWNGQPYEVVQRRIRGNHLAVVDEGRIEGAKVLDAMCFDSLNFDLVPSQSSKETDMPKGIKTRRIIKGSAADSAIEKLKAIVPALQQIIAEGQAETQGTAAATPEADANEPETAAAAPAEGEAAPAEPAEGEAAAVPPAEGEEAAAAPAEGEAAAAAPAEGEAAPAEAAAPAAEGEAAPAQKPEDVQVLVQQVEALVAQLKDMLAPAPAADNCAATMDEEVPPAAAAPAQDCDVTGAMAATDEVEPTVSMEATDNSDPSELAVGDSALKRFYADNVVKTKLYDRVSKVIGAFECAAMDSKEVAVYAAKKLGLNCAADQAVTTVDVYLNGLAKGQKSVSEKAALAAAAMDSANKSDELDAWLKGNM